MTTNAVSSRPGAMACACVGPQNGEPYCPCMMRGRAGAVVEIPRHYMQPYVAPKPPSPPRCPDCGIVLGGPVPHLARFHPDAPQEC